MTSDIPLLLLHRDSGESGTGGGGGDGGGGGAGGGGWRRLRCAAVPAAVG